MNWRFALISLVAAAALLAASCSSGPPRRVSPPAASIQQLTVNMDGSWSVDLRLQNYSSIPMRFSSASLAMTLGDQKAGTLATAPQISIGPESADVVAVELQPSSEARMAVANALAARLPVSYTLEGTLDAVPEDGSSRSFDVDTRNALNPVPGLDGVLR